MRRWLRRRSARVVWDLRLRYHRRRIRRSMEEEMERQLPGSAVGELPHAITDAVALEMARMLVLMTPPWFMEDWYTLKVMRRRRRWSRALNSGSPPASLTDRTTEAADAAQTEGD